MMFRLFILAAVFSASVSAAADGPIIRVRTLKSVKEFELRGVSLHLKAGEAQWSTAGLTRLKIAWKNDLWRLQGGEVPLTAKLKGRSLVVRGAFLQLGGKRIADELQVHARDNGRLDVVVSWPLERYLAGVIPSEMPLYWPDEALKAQAVAARSYAIRMASIRKHLHFDVDGSVYDQVHRTLDEMGLQPRIESKLHEVIRETRGQILRDPSDRVLMAFYSADCGCRSEDPKYVWGESGSFRSVKDPTCGKRRPKEWKLEIQRAALKPKLLRDLKLSDSAVIKTIQIAARSPSGRVSQVAILVEDGGESRIHKISSQRFRRLIGFNKVRSTDFSLQWIGDDLVIRGQGFGHGVGLCQTGARHLAQSGSSYEEILKVYYPQAKVSSL